MRSNSIQPRSRAQRRRARGFTLIEMMMVVAIAGTLASIASTSYDISLAKAKRTEAVALLSGVRTAQAEYFITHGRYAATFDQLGFEAHGARRVSATEIKAKRYTLLLTQPAGERTYYCSATANIDRDPWPDVLVTQAEQP